jgi:hypothetical protein
MVLFSPMLVQDFEAKARINAAYVGYLRGLESAWKALVQTNSTTRSEYSRFCQDFTESELWPDHKVLIS